MALLLTVLLGAGVAAGIYASNQLQQATSAKQEAARSQADAAKQRTLAAEAQVEAERQRKVAAARAEEARQQQILAEERQRLAFSRELASNAIGQLPVDAELGLILAGEAMNVAATSQAQDALRQSLTAYRARAVIGGASSPISVATFSPDGRFVLTLDREAGVRVWEVSSGTRVADFSNPGAKTLCARFATDSRSVVTGHDDGSVRLWTIAGQSLVKTLRGHSGAVLDAAFSANGKLVTSVGAEGTARVWQTEGNGVAVRDVSEETGFLKAVLSEDGQILAAVGNDRRLRVWDTSNGAAVTTLSTRSSEVRDLVLSPQARYLAFATVDRAAELHDLRTGSSKELGFYGHPVSTVAFGRDGRLATTGPDVWTRVWAAGIDADSPLKEFGNDRVNAGSDYVAFSPDGKSLVTASAQSNWAQLWDFASGELVAELRGHTDAITGVGFGPSGKHVLTSSADRTARVWDVSRRRGVVHVVEGTILDEATFSPEGRQLVTPSNGMRLALSVVDTNTGRILRQTASADASYSARYSPDGKLLAGETSTGAKLWDADSDALLTELAGHAGQVNSVEFSHDSLRVVTASDDRTARVWTIATEAFVELRGHTDRVNGAVFSADDEQILTVSADGTARVWESRSGNALRTLTLSGRNVSMGGISPDGRRAVTVTDGGPARLWNLTAGSYVDLARPRESIHTAEFNADGRFLLTAGRQNGDGAGASARWRIWHADTGAEVRFSGTAHTFRMARFSADGRFVITTDGSDFVRLWELFSGRLASELKTFIGTINYLTLSPDGGAMLVHDGQNTAYVYPWESIAPIDELLAVTRRATARRLTALESREYLHVDR